MKERAPALGLEVRSPLSPPISALGLEVRPLTPPGPRDELPQSTSTADTRPALAAPELNAPLARQAYSKSQLKGANAGGCSQLNALFYALFVMQIVRCLVERPACLCLDDRARSARRVAPSWGSGRSYAPLSAA
jgi:hypothetical protein